MGSSPDVVNLWMGDNRAVSSLHKDPYENIYVVVSGEKHFTLLPPTDLHYLYDKPFPGARYKEDENGWKIVEDDPPEEVNWIPVDPDSPDLETYPLFRHASPVRCTVKAGEVLFLPSLWYHKVSQGMDEENRTLAINYWYDMNFGANWCFHRFLNQISHQNRNN